MEYFLYLKRVDFVSSNICMFMSLLASLFVFFLKIYSSANNLCFQIHVLKLNFIYFILFQSNYLEIKANAS